MTEKTHLALSTPHMTAYSIPTVSQLTVSFPSECTFPPQALTSSHRMSFTCPLIYSFLTWRYESSLWNTSESFLPHLSFLIFPCSTFAVSKNIDFEMQVNPLGDKLWKDNMYFLISFHHHYLSQCLYTHGCLRNTHSMKEKWK